MRRVRRKGANKEKVFGCDLLEHLTASCQEIPQVLRCCSEFVEHHGVVDGIYRLSGVSSNIQKLRGEFENDGNPDLNKDVYLQDIHCVSSLCKAYFRELPNPLLTYQLYDKFAEAVAIQLEEERLVKIRDVLKELPAPHYRTLEFLMHHLVRMASFSSETNMHARNLAIVWAPNLLRSKDIEASGFNGTAAFMEVRVQSIVVEFILTHVPQLFPEPGVSNERRKSLPSPSALSNQEEPFFKSMPNQPVHNFGNISPGDGPLAIRPYHAIIEGTDKRKGSLKGKKWMSIFNIGGRFPDPRRKHKHSAKEKERPALRPARSMDSLSSPSYPNEGSRRPAQRPPSTSMSPLVTASPKPSTDVAVSVGAIGGSEYAVTYRRGTGLVSGGVGTQGTYTALDPEGLGIAGNESVQTRSPGLSTKVGRRAAMHITGPTMVTVPLHITSNLALGVLQGGGGDRVIHRGRDKDGGDKGEDKEGEDKVDRKESGGMEKKMEEGIKVKQEEKNLRRKEREGVVDMEGITVVVGGGDEEKHERAKEEEKKEEEEREDCRRKPELVMRGLSRERQARSLNSNANDEDAADNDQDVDDNDEYMEMKGVKSADPQPPVTQHDEDCNFDSSDILNSTEAEGDDQELSGYVQDNFEFLDQMDCSLLDHMDCSISYQVNEFSVEPPGHSDDEYEVMVQSQHPAELNELNPHRPLSLDVHSRHTKSLSLPHMTSPIHGPEALCSEEEEDPEDNSNDNDYSSEEDESMFVKSLPPDFFLNNMSEIELDSDTQESCTLDRLPADESNGSEERELETLHIEEPSAGDREQGEVKAEFGIEGKLIMKKEEEDALDKEGDQPEKHMQSRTAVEDLSDLEKTPDVSIQGCVEFPLPPNEDTDESSTMTDLKVEEEKEEIDNIHSNYSTCSTDSSVLLLEESRDSAGSTEHPRPSCVTEDTEDRESDGIEAVSQEMAVETKENDENKWEEPTEEGSEEITDNNYEENEQEDGKEQDSVICGTSDDIWDELEDVICEVIEDEENELAGQEDVEKKQKENILEEKMVEMEEGGKTDVRIEVEEESAEEKITDPKMQQEFEEKETFLPKTTEEEETNQGMHAFNDEAQHRDREEVISKEHDRENNDEERGDERVRTPPRALKQQKEVKPDVKKWKEHSDISQGGVERKLIITKHPKVHQVKAVPVVPPKPQHCKITALSLRQQQQQRERRDGSRGRENMMQVLMEQDRVCAGEQGRDGGEARDRNSPLSMCFDEAVAIATMRREKEKECEKDRQREVKYSEEV